MHLQHELLFLVVQLLYIQNNHQDLAFNHQKHLVMFKWLWNNIIHCKYVTEFAVVAY